MGILGVREREEDGLGVLPVEDIAERGRVLNMRKGRAWISVATTVVCIGILAGCQGPGAAAIEGRQIITDEFDDMDVIEDEYGAVVLRGRREVAPGLLEITETRSHYAHSQHLVFVRGRYNSVEGHLVLTLLDDEGNELESSNFREPDMLDRGDGQWTAFDHKLIEDTWTRVDVDRGIICFELRDGDQVIAEVHVNIPLRRPLP